MGILHTVNKSPFTHGTLLSCLGVCGKNDGLLLLEDGVFGALLSSPHSEELISLIQQGATAYALSSDVNARGISKKLHPAIQVIDYDGFVQLSVAYRCVQSWY